MQSSSNIRRRWRSWIHQLDEQITLPAYLDKAIFERYVEIVEGNKRIQTPGNFHHWIFRNYAHSLAIRIRKLVDTDSRAVSLRGLLGAIGHNAKVLTRRSFLSHYPAHFQGLGEQNWVSHCGGRNRESFPAGVALKDLQLVNRIAERVVRIVNKEIVHHERGRRYRTLHMDRAHSALQDLHRVLVKYGDICGRSVPFPYDIQDMSGWDQIFRQRWLASQVGAQLDDVAGD